ncbi:MAG TPA: GNAT family protein [Puia sp.]|nr:GNAT family protein [Puia sp.]
MFISEDQLHLLRGKSVYLEFLKQEHREQLRSLARDERLWEFTKTLLITDSFDHQFNKYFDDALAFAARGDQAFAILETGTRRPIGMTRAYDVDFRVKKVTIGHTWYVPEVWGRAHNKECKLLLLRYIFDTLGFERTDFKVAGENLRSQRAVEKIGGVKEGVLRRFAMRNDGTPADTVYFSILGNEWPERRQRLQAMVDAL